jgi:propanol-preferring alcohol dehydrogenase
MKAAVLTEDRRLDLVDMPDPIGEGWAVVETKAAGVCGTDLHFFEGLLTPPRFPFVLGHEIAGILVECPPGSGFTPGDRVVIYNFVGCGTCEWCRGDRMPLCTSPQGQLGFSLAGGFCDFVRAPTTNLLRLPAAIPFETAAALGCSAMTAVHAARRAGISRDSIVVVNGVGGVGASVIQVASSAGAHVIAVADAEAKAELARELGAIDALVLATSRSYEDLSGHIRALTDGRGADFFFELVATRTTMKAGISSLAPGGCFVLIAYGQDELTFDPLQLISSEIRVVASCGGTRGDLEEAIRLAASGQLRIHIGQRYRLDQIGAAVERLQTRSALGRSVIVW